MRRLKNALIAAFWLLAMATVFAAEPVLAQQSPDVTNCVNKDNQVSNDVRIGACTAVIRSGAYEGKNLAWALNNRGIAHDGNNDFDSAIADFTQAIQLNPQFTSAYYNRGRAYAAKKDYSRAVTDYSTAIALAPPANVYAEGGTKQGDRIRSDYFFGRGQAYRNMGDSARAIADLQEAVRLDPGNSLAVRALREVGG